MTRKISGGLVGQPGFVSAVQISPTAVISTVSNQDITMSPGGGATVLFSNGASISNSTKLRFLDLDNSNGIAFQSPNVVAADVTLTLPSADGAQNQALTTDGSGTLSWRTPTIAVATDTADSNTNYLLFTTTISGDISAADVSTSGARFIPSSGTIINPVITGGTSASNTLTLRSTTNATKGQVYIDETTASSSTTTGALRVGGGVGIGGNAYIGGDISVAGNTSGILGNSFISGATTLANVDRLLVVNATSAFTITLPSSPTTGRTFVFVDGGNFSVNNITIARNGSTIENVAEDFIINVSTRVQFTYSGTTWRVIA